MSVKVEVYFSDSFGVSLDQMEEWGAFNVCLITDLPLFVDPFLLFNSECAEYMALHDEIIRYLKFLRSRSETGHITKGLLKAWYHFCEVDENCFGFCKSGHSGRGLGPKFARALNKNLHDIFNQFGDEQITESSHLEKQLEIYQAASDAPYGFKVIIYFNERDKLKVERVLRELKLDKDDHVYLVDARSDNKPSGSNA